MVKTLQLLLWGLLSPLLLFAQVFQFSDPAPLPYSINSDGQEALPIISKDGKSLFFSRSLWEANTGGKFSGHDIWVSEHATSGWARATNTQLGFNTKGNDAIIGTNETGTTLYIMRTYPNKKVHGIYFSNYKKGQWTTPELIPIDGLESMGSFGFYMHPAGDLLLISMQAGDAVGEEDLYISIQTKSGWSKARNLGTTINTSGYEISPFLSEDKRRLFFSSNGHKGLGDADIFMSERLYDSWETWTMPVNLGDKVNSSKFDAYFSIYGDTLALFASNKKGRNADLYSTRVSIIAQPNGEMIPLAEKEVRDLLGANVASKVTFENQETELDATQRELLWFISMKLVSEKDVKILLVPSIEDSREIAAKRMEAVLVQLARSGIEGSRIRRPDAQHVDIDLHPRRGEVNLLLVR